MEDLLTCPWKTFVEKIGEITDTKELQNVLWQLEDEYLKVTRNKRITKNFTFSDVKGIDESKTKDRKDGKNKPPRVVGITPQLLKDLDLDLNMSLSKMSKGMKEKVQLVLVMSRRAKLYILDEPLGGVDPTTRDYILKTILSNFGEDSSLIITTHIINDVEKILDEVIFIDKGKIILNDSADGLRLKEKKSIDEIFRSKVKWLKN